MCEQAGMRRTQPLEQRFWKRVDKRGPDECWPWTGAVVSKTRPYGILSIQGRSIRASRISWSLSRGETFPPSKLACHSCDNPNCVNPAHIWIGTPRDNTHDMLRKGRAAHQKNPKVAKQKRPEGICQRGHAYHGQRPYPSDRAGTRRCRICHYQSTYAAEQRRNISKESSA